MKKLLLLLGVVVATGLFAPGCQKSENTVTAAAPTNMEYNYTYDKREVFIDDASGDLQELDRKISELADKVTTAGKSAMAAVQPKLDDLRQQRSALAKKLEALKSAQEADWNELKTDYQKAKSDMTASLQESWNAVQTNSGS